MALTDDDILTTRRITMEADADTKDAGDADTTDSGDADTTDGGDSDGSDAS